MIINFTKLQGAGNGYIAIDGRDITITWGKLAIEMGDPAFGVGSDGIVVVENSKLALLDGFLLFEDEKLFLSDLLKLLKLLFLVEFEENLLFLFEEFLFLEK